MRGEAATAGLKTGAFRVKPRTGFMGVPSFSPYHPSDDEQLSLS
jgi:hypothetical protein